MRAAVLAPVLVKGMATNGTPLPRLPLYILAGSPGPAAKTSCMILGLLPPKKPVSRPMGQQEEPFFLS
jgi:hypothetical protein